MGQYFTNQKLKSNIKKINCVIRGKRFEFYTDNGVFSKDGLDFGSRLLLDFIPLEEVGGKVLDLGCGYGIIGIIINKITGASVHMVDVNLRALHLADMNIELNKCENVYAYESNCYETVDEKFIEYVFTLTLKPEVKLGKYKKLDVKKDKVLIIHGKGSGIIRKTTHETLRKNRYVDNFQIDFFNDGNSSSFILFLLFCDA